VGTLGSGPGQAWSGSDAWCSMARILAGMLPTKAASPLLPLPLVAARFGSSSAVAETISTTPRRSMACISGSPRPCCCKVCRLPATCWDAQNSSRCCRFVRQRGLGGAPGGARGGGGPGVGRAAGRRRGCAVRRLRRAPGFLVAGAGSAVRTDLCPSTCWNWRV
jgi:hypothetical protein